MKLTNFLATTLILSQSLLLTLPKSVNAQLSCQGTIDNIVSQIRAKGVSDVELYVNRGGANEYHIDNPTMRQDILSISMINKGMRNYYIVDNILSSPQLMNSWANSITKACDEKAVVNFSSMYEAGWIASYAIQPDLTTRLRDCTDNWDTPRSWNEIICP